MTKAERYIKEFYATRVEREIDYAHLTKSEIESIIDRFKKVMVDDESPNKTGYDDFELDCAMLCNPSLVKIELTKIIWQLVNNNGNQQDKSDREERKRMLNELYGRSLKLLGDLEKKINNDNSSDKNDNYSKEERHADLKNAVSMAVEKKKCINAPYPLCVVMDRYDGTYSGGKWLAFNAYSVPSVIFGDDLDCANFWGNYTEPVGKGNTPTAAIIDLNNKLNK